MASSSQRQTPEDELLDPATFSLLRRLAVADGSIHANHAEELNANDADGLQGGQGWDNPTRSPTLRPSLSPTRFPTDAPTGHPTLSGQEWVVRGTVWYDRNANGVRDSNVAVADMGDDVEFTQGLGGANLQLVQCDPTTERAYAPAVGETLESFANTQTAGVSIRGEAQLVPTHNDNGKFEIHLVNRNGLERYYYVQVLDAPNEFRFTAGICNDDEPGWGCDYPDQPADSSGANVTDRAQGILSGRSPGCVFVNKRGEIGELINFGVMRVGDTQMVGADVALVLEFENNAMVDLGRRLADILRRARVIATEDDGPFVTTRYLLANKDKVAIGTVTAEVLASALDARLAQSNVQLESVNPKEVIFSTKSDESDDALGGGGGTSELAVNMEILGHYSPPPYLDFDYIVQDSINRDTAKIRRGLRDYNMNCRDQTEKVRDKGYKEENFDAVVSTSGAKHRQKKDLATSNNIYSTACSTDLFVPQYFETSLKEIGARDVNDPFNQLHNVVYYAQEKGGMLESWAIGPVAGLAGMIMLLLGLFVFRRSIGPRRVDTSSSATKSNEIAGDELRRFGEAGADVDDGSIDSAFYTESDSDMDETEKERRMRFKRKDKANEQRSDGNTKPRRKNGAARGNLASSTRNSKRMSVRKERKLLAMSQGSDDTRKSKRSTREERKLLAMSQVSNDTMESLSLSIREEEDAKMKKSSRGNDRKPSAKKSSSSSGEKRNTSDRHVKRGRSKRKGGDNATAYDESRVV